jgi:predicted nucleic acid-binding Zn ribbon protein
MDVTPGIRADATKVIAAYRRSFVGMGKTLARRRVVEAFHAAGATVVLDLWGGGLSARELIAAGFKVVCVESGSMELEIGGRTVSAVRKRRAFEIDAMDAGFIPFWGSAAAALAAFPDIDAAFLDYCGPWSGPARETIHAARHLKIVTVTLMPHHDISTGATSIQERQLAYQLFLKMAWAKAPRWGYMSSSGCRILTDYDTAKRRRATVYLLGASVRLKAMDINERSKMREDMYDRHRGYQLKFYQGLNAGERQAFAARNRHNDHLRRGVGPRKPCPICGEYREVLCLVCQSQVCGYKGNRYCSTACAKSAKADRQRARRPVTFRRLAAVSGTTAEAIKD